MNNKKSNIYVKLIAAAFSIGILSAFIFFSLKKTTEWVEETLFNHSTGNIYLSILFPVLALSLISVLRVYLFKNKENKGIRELGDALKLKKPSLPIYKIPSHYINGFLTIVGGGSTGIEVSSVVGAGAVGSTIGNQLGILKKYRAELICAGSAAAITVLFNSPIAGIFFAYEVLYKKITKSFLLLSGISVITAWLFNYFIHEEPLFYVEVTSWHIYAIPYFVLLGIFAGFHSVYLTKIVIYFKQIFASVPGKYLSIIMGAILIGLLIFFFPALYGDGYHSIKNLFSLESQNFSGNLILFIAIVLLKPIATSLTLAAGGDGGVFAPSLVMGAFLGMLTSFILNHYFNQQVVPVNFMMVGMAAVLCASIQAPFTSIFLVCGVTNNYVLIVPLLIGCLISRLTAHLLYPHTAYNHPLKPVKN